MISYEEAISVLRSLQERAKTVKSYEEHYEPDYRDFAGWEKKDILDTLMDLDLSGDLLKNPSQSTALNAEEDLFSYDEALCPFGREFTVADLPRLTKTKKRDLTKEELIQNRLIEALTDFQSPDFNRSNVDIVIEYRYGEGFVSSTYRAPSKNNVAAIFVPKKEGKAFLKKGPGWSRFDPKPSLGSQIHSASSRTATPNTPAKEMTRDV